MRSRQSAFGLAGYDDSDSDACVTYDTHGSEFDDLPCAKGAKGEHDDEEAEAHSYANSDPRRFELRCVIGVVRHGDRTPKQKMKLKLKIKGAVQATAGGSIDLLVWQTQWEQHCCHCLKLLASLAQRKSSN